MKNALRVLFAITIATTSGLTLLAQQYPAIQVSIREGGNEEIVGTYKSWDEVMALTVLQSGKPVKVKVWDEHGKELKVVFADIAVRSISVHPSYPNVVYVGLKGNAGDGKVAKSVDGGTTWDYLNNGKPLDEQVDDVQCIVSSPYKKDHLLAGTWKNGLFQSFDDGVTWKKLENFPDADIRYVLFDPTSSKIIYAATTKFGVVRSEDEGKTWSVPTPEKLLSEFQSAWSLRANPKTNSIYACTILKGVFESKDQGNTWAKLLDVPGQICYDMAISKSNPTQLWVAASGQTANSLFYSNDAGATWTEAKNLPAGELFQQVELIQSKGKEVVLVGGQKGTYVYANDSFVLKPSILSFPSVCGIIQVGDKVLISTWGNGITILNDKL